MTLWLIVCPQFAWWFQCSCCSACDCWRSGYDTTAGTSVLLGAALPAVSDLLNIQGNAVPFPVHIPERKSLDERDGEVICIMGDWELLNEPCENSSLKCSCAWLFNAKRALLLSYKTSGTSGWSHSNASIVIQTNTQFRLRATKTIGKKQ